MSPLEWIVWLATERGGRRRLSGRCFRPAPTAMFTLVLVFRVVRAVSRIVEEYNRTLVVSGNLEFSVSLLLALLG